MKLHPLFIAGLLMMPVCVLGLLYQESYIWIVCPQSLVTMFLRQSQYAYDSLGAAGSLDVSVAILYYPTITEILARAARKGKLRPVARKVLIWHLATIGLAIFLCWFRNRLWYM